MYTFLSKFSPYLIVITKMSLLCRYQTIITKLSLLWTYQILITKLSLPNCLYQIVITKSSLPNCRYQKSAHPAVAHLEHQRINLYTELQEYLDCKQYCTLLCTLSKLLLLWIVLYRTVLYNSMFIVNLQAVFTTGCPNRNWETTWISSLISDNW